MPLRGRRSARAQLRTIAMTCGAAALAVAPSAGAAPKVPAAKPAPPGAGGAPSTGGTGFVPPPVIKRVACLRPCAAGRRPQNGSRLRIVGTSLAGVTKALFEGGRGTADDVVARVRRGSDRSLTTVIPAAAKSGPVTLVVDDRVKSEPSRPLSILPPPAPEPQAQLTPVPGPREPGAPALETGTSTPKLFAGQQGGIVFSFRVKHSAPAVVRIDLLRTADGAVVQSWSPPPVTPDTIGSVKWDGLGGAPQPEGRYAFRAVAQSSSGATARSAQVQDLQRDAFDLYANVFPVRGRHDYGQAGARFGSGRAGHSHQGQDVFARCGTRLVAARGGVVKARQYHAAAGHYIVIDGDGTDVDYLYAHLTAPAPFKAGDRVFTGQQLGQVGDSGNASGCHLHFELWGPPGWYTGGQPFDPLAHLQAWDGYS